MAKTVGEIHDWHNPHNDKCPQNGERVDKDCTCVQPTKRKRDCGLVNRAKLRSRLLEETNARNKARMFTQVRPEKLDEAEAVIKQWLIKQAENPPRTGKTL